MNTRRCGEFTVDYLRKKNVHNFLYAYSTDVFSLGRNTSNVILAMTWWILLVSILTTAMPLRAIQLLCNKRARCWVPFSKSVRNTTR